MSLGHQLNVRLSDEQYEALRAEAAASGFASVSEYARRKLAVTTAVDRIAQNVDLLLARVEEIAAQQRGGVIPETPSRPQVFSTQYGQLVDVDADGREIPPE